MVQWNKGGESVQIHRMLEIVTLLLGGRALTAGALAERDGPAGALAALDALAQDPRLADYQPYWAARADLLARNRMIGERIALLTPREKEVLQGIFEGKLTKVIAQELGIGVRTAETYRQLIMQKLQAGSVAELVRIVVESMPRLNSPVS